MAGGARADTAINSAAVGWGAVSFAMFVAASAALSQPRLVSRWHDALGPFFPLVVGLLLLAWVPFALLAVTAAGAAAADPIEAASGDDPVPAPVPAPAPAPVSRAEEERQQFARRIRSLLNACEDMEIVFQPLVDLRTSGIVGYEALARFRTDPYLPPDHWFVEAHELGLGVEVELLALRRALERLDELPDGTSMSVNVSARTLQHDSFHELMRTAPSHRLLLELTEHALVEDYDVLNERLVPIRALGAELVVDDAGAGFASLSHILNLAPDVIKLDRHLTASIDLDANRRAMVTSLVAFADETGARIVAEGIERSEELDALRAADVRYGQGYLLGRPGPLPTTPNARHRVDVR
jgi:EAL domain-containing protein (putative c-di-GMP-specific phosphodiesterase class I)